MFRSLQSRLWLTYALLTFIILSILAAGLFLYILRFPGEDRQTIQQLEVSARVIRRLYEQGTFRAPLTQRRIENLSDQFSLRILIFDAVGGKIFDSNPQEPEIRWREANREVPSRGMIRDVSNQTWLYTAQKLSPDRALLLVSPRQGGLTLLQSPQFRNVLRDEFLPPFIRAGAVALFLALLLAYGMSRWISRPIANVTHAARKIADGEYQQIPPQGPREVRSLTRAFNDMVSKVKSTQQSQRNFVANVSHELKTPLTSIQGFAQAMVDGTVESVQEMKKSARIIQGEAERMFRLVLDLLELARYDAGTIKLDKREVDFEEMLSKIVEKMVLQANKEGVDLDLDIDPLPAFHGDPYRLSQVFSNIIENGIKYTPSGGEVVIRGRCHEDQIEISVKDTGRGIPEDEISRVFDRFYQVDKSRGNGDDPSSGLGLAIAQEIVQAHGGQITLRSRQGLGSRFSVRLPLRDTAGGAENG